MLRNLDRDSLTSRSRFHDSLTFYVPRPTLFLFLLWLTSPCPTVLQTSETLMSLTLTDTIHHVPDWAHLGKLITTEWSALLPFTSNYSKQYPLDYDALLSLRPCRARHSLKFWTLCAIFCPFPFISSRNFSSSSLSRSSLSLALLWSFFLCSIYVNSFCQSSLTLFLPTSLMHLTDSFQFAHVLDDRVLRIPSVLRLSVTPFTSILASSSRFASSSSNCFADFFLSFSMILTLSRNSVNLFLLSLDFVRQYRIFPIFWRRWSRSTASISHWKKVYEYFFHTIKVKYRLDPTLDACRALILE